MRTKQATKRLKSEDTEGISKRFKEGMLIFLTSLAIYLSVALVSYHQTDPGWSHVGMSKPITNAAGITGAWFADLFYSLFGFVAYFFPIALFSCGLFIYGDHKREQPTHPMLWTMRGLGILLTLFAACGLISLFWQQSQYLPMTTGGMLGISVKNLLVALMNQLGATIILFSFLLIGVTLFSGLSWFQLMNRASKRSFAAVQPDREKLRQVLNQAFERAAQLKLPNLWPNRNEDVFDDELPFSNKPIVEQKPLPLEEYDDVFSEPLPSLEKPVKSIRKAVKEKLSSVKSEAKVKIKSEFTSEPKARKFNQSHALPSLDLLEIEAKKQRLGYTSAQLHDLSKLVESRLLEFGVDAKVVGVQPGPVITRFELDLAAGIKVNKITGLAKDLARSLSVVSVRVVEVIPGKSVVGLEIPNVHRELVRLREVLEDPTYQQAPSPLTLALGKDISGRPVAVDLGKMPHLLVAGTTGSGKSVGINAMLLSILFKATPDEVRLILIDPKMLELAIYDNIPHLLTPVVTDMKDAANALRWCVAEMERRYQLMAAMGVRNLAGYNQKIETALKQKQPIMDPLWHPQSNTEQEQLEKLPYIVVVVDEFADMMMVVGKKVEELIARIAQKARAAGIHLIIATQRPSVDVITGLIKANIPTRIAFQVSSRIDSRTIIDQSGSEQLLGHGDMLYLPPGVGIPHRIHGAFVSDEEVHQVTDELRKLGSPTYIESVVQSMPTPLAMGDEDYDEFYDQAVVIVVESRKASISLVQRRLKIGYNRAARLLERMEQEGVVSSMQSNGLREVLAPPLVD